MSYSQSAQPGWVTPFTASAPVSSPLSLVVDPLTGKLMSTSRQPAFNSVGIPQNGPLGAQLNQFGPPQPVTKPLPQWASVPAPVAAQSSPIEAALSPRPEPAVMPMTAAHQQMGDPGSRFSPEDWTTPLPALEPKPDLGNPSGDNGFLGGSGTQPEGGAGSAKAVSNVFDDLDGARLNPRDPATPTATLSSGNGFNFPPGQGMREAQGYADPKVPQDQLERLWKNITAGESGGSADPTHAKNPNSSAYGKAQFIDSTRDNFLSSPAAREAGYTVDDFKNKPEVQRAAFNWLVSQNAAVLAPFSGGQGIPDGALEAAHAIGAGGVAALMSHKDEKVLDAYRAGTGKDGQKALITNNPAWGIKPDDTADQALHKIAGYYDKRGSKSAPAASETTSTPPQGAQVTPASYNQLGPDEHMDPPKGPAAAPTGLPTTLAGYRPASPADEMLAMASGIFQGGPGQAGLANGLGKGLAAMQKLRTDDQTNRYKIGQEIANTDLLRKRLDLVGAQTRKTDAAIDQADTKNDIGRTNAETNAARTAGNLALGGRRVGVQEDRFNAQTNGTLAAGHAAGQDTLAVQKDMQTDQNTSGQALQDIANLRTIIADDPNVTGSQSKAKVARWFADNLGVDVGVNPDTNAIATKLIAQFNNTNSLAGAKGTFGRLTQGEASWLKQGAANAGTTPGGWQALLGTYETIAKSKMELANRYNGLLHDPDKYKQVLSAPGGVRAWVTEQQNQLLQQRGITPSQPVQAEYSKGPNGQWQHVDVPGVDAPVRIRINGVTQTQQ